MLIDSHDCPVADAVWKLFDVIICQCGPIPTLIEWDSDLPEWARLKAEADAAQTIIDRHVQGKAMLLEGHDGSFCGEPSYAAAFARALLDPDLATPAAVAGPRSKAAVKRYNVYRNNVTVSLIDALAAAFPATLRISGVDFFRAMARFYVRATPPTSPLLFDYGRDFADFIERYEYAQSVPWLADVARIERAWLDAYHAADVQPLKRHELAAIPSEQLPNTVLKPHPATRIICSRFSAVTIFTPVGATDRPAVSRLLSRRTP